MKKSETIKALNTLHKEALKELDKAKSDVNRNYQLGYLAAIVEALTLIRM